MKERTVVGAGREGRAYLSGAGSELRLAAREKENKKKCEENK